jgi:diguanylate cyclase (GGDEF)-like protein
VEFALLNSNDFLTMILDTIDHHIAVIDQQGEIQFVNHSWISFGDDNGCVTDMHWRELNYLKVCQDSAAAGDEFGRNASRGIEQVIGGELDNFTLEYPCHSQGEYRWFMMQITKSMSGETSYYIIVHHDITQRKLAEEKALSLANIDGLTKIANRRCFDKVVEDEWRRGQRLLIPLSLLMIDIDCFKLLNDDYGHPSGDKLLKLLAKELTRYTKRPGDLCARYGGEEFVVVLANTYSVDALAIAEAIRTAIVGLNYPNASAPEKIVTISAGLVTMIPDKAMDAARLIKLADEQLYQAKHKGKNQVVWLDFATPEL